MILILIVAFGIGYVICDSFLQALVVPGMALGLFAVEAIDFRITWGQWPWDGGYF